MWKGFEIKGSKGQRSRRKGGEMLIYPVYEVINVKNDTTENEDSKTENIESNKTQVQKLKCTGKN